METDMEGEFYQAAITGNENLRDMEGKFYQAAITGNENLLYQLVDSISVDGAEFAKETPVHIAAKYGHSNIVREILRRRPAFAFRLNSEGQTPLHLASAKGHLDAVKVLLGENNNDRSQQRKLSDACFIRDKQGRSPLHLAAMNGHVEVLRGLVQTESSAAWVVTDGGQSSLHLCAHNDYFDGVEELIGLVSEKVVFINNLKDDDDNNILHLLAAKRQYKMINRLVNDNEGVDINAMNRYGETVLDVALKNVSGIVNLLKIGWPLVSIGAKTAKRMVETSPVERTRRPPGDNFGKWLSEMRGNLLVVAILMATVTFQATVSPPGGVWQDDLYFDNKTGNFITTPYVVPNGTGKWYSISTNESLTVIHKAGTPIMSDKDPFTSLFFTVSNTVGFAASVVVIVILAGGFSFQEDVFMFWWMTWMAMIALSSMLLSYCCSIFLLSYRVVLMVPLAFAGIFTSLAFVQAYLQAYLQASNGLVSSSKLLTQIHIQIPTHFGLN